MKGRFPSLDGWRAISILLVLGNHIPRMPGSPWEHSQFLLTYLDGNLGVRFFFVISGFLITWLMLKDETEFGKVNLKNFYIRRTLRIWPVYVTFVILLFALQSIGVVHQTGSAWRGLLTFTRNFYDEDSGTPGDSVSGHCWSLSIEEQFYLFWPIIFYFTGRKRLWFLLFAILFSAGFRTVELLGLYERHYAHYLFQEFSTFNYLDHLGWGCLGAFVLADRKDTLEALVRKKPAICFSFLFSFILIPYLIRLGNGLQAIGLIGLLLHSVICPNWMFYRILNFKWVTKIGIWSYSIYIWQQLVWMLWPPVMVKVWFLWIPVAFGVAWLSYEFLEKPFFSLRAKFRD
jgi:peptidoglycan/LPS O-acetylase OafA/YrhL